MITYPIPGGSLGGVTVAQATAFLQNPTLIARRFAEIIADHNFLAHYLLRQRYTMSGGAAAYVPDEATSTGAQAQTVAPGGEYPLSAIPTDVAVLVAALKKGLGTEIPDEVVGRDAMDAVERAFQMLAFDVISQFDASAISAIQSAVTSTTTGGAWTAAATIVGNVELAKATIKGQKRGYRATSVVLTDVQWATVSPLLLPLLPREASNPIVAGSFPNILGVDWISSPDLPSGWVPFVTDANNLGGIGHENIPSPEYIALSSIADNRSNVEVARFREKNDATRIQLRKADVPIVTNPKAGTKITGTGL